MGTSGNLIQSSRKKHSQYSDSFNGRRRRYEDLHKKFDFFISREFNDTLTAIDQTTLINMNKLIEEAYNSNYNKIKQSKMSKEDFFDLMYETVTVNVINTHLAIQDYDIFKNIEILFPFLFPGEGEAFDFQMERCRTVLSSFEKDFETNLRSIVYDLKGDLKTLHIDGLYGINRNLKFNPNCKPNILNLILTPYLLDDYDFMVDVAEIVEYCDTLQIVNIIINPVDENGKGMDVFNFNISDHTLLNFLLTGVLNNRKVKGLFIQSLKDHRIVLAPEIGTLIINKLQSETLVAFHLGKFLLSNEFLNKLLFQVSSTRSLKYFSLDSRKIWNNNLTQKIQPALIANNSLLAVSLTGFILPPKQEVIEEFYNKLKEENEGLLVIYIGKDTLVTYPFDPESLLPKKNQSDTSSV